MFLAVGLLLVTGAQAIFFGGGGGGGGGCCCGCGTPQPASCGCQPATQEAVDTLQRPVAVADTLQVPAVVDMRQVLAAVMQVPAAAMHLHLFHRRIATLVVGFLAQADDAQTSSSSPASSSSGNFAPPLNAKLRSPEAPTCEPAKIKYVVLRAKKVRGGPGNEEVMEEVEEVDHPAPVEATASPLEAKEIGDDISRNEATEDEEDQLRAQGTPTFSDAKCNSKPLRDLITDNIVREDALASKRAIHESSLKRFPEATVDVICSGTGFTYLVSTTEHCEAQKDNVICFVYKRPLLRH
ncbi:ground-like domain protein [Ancylostoma caninum]|uniref:Ground-like domain protein n=1 Tax=Ancylostoma caninum TaxID=29170 RepID=A0A368H5N2_ANCCA|nr:ground-like domain protein [Ancylostoma caninum]